MDINLKAERATGSNADGQNFFRPRRKEFKKFLTLSNASAWKQWACCLWMTRRQAWKISAFSSLPWRKLRHSLTNTSRILGLAERCVHLLELCLGCRRAGLKFHGTRHDGSGLILEFKLWHIKRGVAGDVQCAICTTPSSISARWCRCQLWSKKINVENGKIKSVIYWRRRWDIDKICGFHAGP